MDNKRPLIAHLCLFCSGAFWGLMAPVGKDAMLHGINGIDLVSFRVLGGAILFWLTSLFTKKEQGMAEIGTLTGADILSKYVRDYGFGSETGIELPGEGAGILYNPEDMSKLDVATMSIGQGIERYVRWISEMRVRMHLPSQRHALRLEVRWRFISIRKMAN